MDAPLFYQLLLSELQLGQNDPGAAYSLILDASHRTGRTELYRRAVEVALQARAGAAALNAARQWSQALPDTEDAYRYQLQILLALNRPAELAPVLQDLVRLAPPNKRAAVIAAIPQALERAPDQAAALNAAREALGPSLRAPETASAAWAAIGRMQLVQHAWDDALNAAQQALAHPPHALSAAVLALELLEQGQAPVQAPAQALVRHYLDSAEPPQTPDTLNVRLAYTRLLIDQRRWTEATAELAPLLQQQPALAEAWLLQGSLQTQMRESAPAEATLKHYLALSAALPAEAARRGQTQAYLHLAELAERRDDLAAAGTWLDRIEKPEDMTVVQLRRATLLARQGHLDAARQLLHEPAARNDDDRRRQFMAEVQMLRQVGRHDLVLQVYETAAQHFGSDPDLQYEWAMAAEKAGRPADMERLLRALIASHPDYHHAYNALGYALADRNERLDEAKTLIEQALAAAPNDAFILDSLGWVEFRRGQHTEALRLLRQAHQLRPDAEIAAHLGEVHWALGQREEALAVWREALLAHPHNDTLRQTLRRLQVQP